MAANISGPGCLYTESKISRPDVLDEKTYLKWYTEDRLPEIIQTPGVKSARIFKDINSEADKPYLSICPVDDLGSLTSEEFKNIKVKSDILPETGIVYDLADMDIRCDSLIQVFDPTKKGKGHTKSIISVQIELKEGGDAEDFDKWYREEHLLLLAKATGYLRTTRFKLAYARNNAQFRALSGLPATNEPAYQPPVWLSVHEFEVEKPDLLEIKNLTASPWTEKIHEGRKLGIFKIYTLLAEFGEKDWFHGVEV